MLNIKLPPVSIPLAPPSFHLRNHPELLNKFMIKAKVPNFITLFKMMDEDNSGLICFKEFQKVVRAHLLVPKLERGGLSDEELTAVWCSIDDDEYVDAWCSQDQSPFLTKRQSNPSIRSGHINAGEFGAFLRLGDSVHDKTRREKALAVEAAKEQKVQAVRDER